MFDGRWKMERARASSSSRASSRLKGLVIGCHWSFVVIHCLNKKDAEISAA